MRPKKIILIVIDALRRDHLGCYGYERDTSPNIDVLAKKGILFKHAFSVCPNTLPSIASILTSKYPGDHSIGFNPEGKLNPDIDKTLAVALRDADYKTAAFVSNSVLKRETGLNAGFEVYNDEIANERRDCILTNEKVFSWLDENHRQDFYLFIHYSDVNGPYINAGNYKDTFIDDEFYGTAENLIDISEEWMEFNKIPQYQVLTKDGKDVKDVRYYKAQYDACIRNVDENLQKLIQKLKELKIYQDALVLITSDSGEALGENNVFFNHGASVSLDQIAVPLLIKLHEDCNLKPGIRELPVSTIDIMPMLLALCGMEGFDLSLEGKDEFILKERVLISENEQQFAIISPNRLMELKKKDAPISNFYPAIPSLIDSLHEKRYYWDSGNEYLLTLIFDEYQRYRIIADIINKLRKNKQSFRILDIGAGFKENLKRFLPEDEIYFLDKCYPPEYAEKYNYISGDFTKLNLNETFDFVVSSDVYEHIHPVDREKFINNLLHLSEIAGILAAPFDTPGVREHEILTNDLYKFRNGFENICLHEHILNGLPSLTFTLELIKKSGLNYTVIPNGYLPRWFDMISTYFLTAGITEFSKIMDDLYEFYNKNFYCYDNLNPAYRQVIIISKVERNPDFSDIYAKNQDNDFKIKYEMLQSFFNKIRDSVSNYRYHELTEKNKELIERVAQVAKLTEDLRAKDLVIENLEASLQEKNIRINDLNSALLSIHQSLTWRMLMKYHRIMEQMLPLGTRRRKLYDTGLMNFRSFLNTGLKSLLHKVSFTPKIERSFDMREINVLLEFYKNRKKPDSITKHNCTVDIIICIHNALDDVKKCLESILRYTAPPYSLILVDDGSDIPTRLYLEDFGKSYGAYLIRNDAARGYTFASNQGLRFSTADFVVLLNSDTIVTHEWIDRMVECAESDTRTGIVGPLSNTASWQSVPDIETNGDWAPNTLPPDITIETMGRLIAKYSARLYPDIPFLNGFCLMIKRSLINDIGYFDEETFGKGYGEEDDFSIRARKSGWNLRVADDVYIYHAQSRSYSNEKRKELCERSGKALIKKHGEAIISDGVLKCRYDRVLEGIRARTKEMFGRQELIREAKKKWEGKRILTILPVMDPGGGAYVVMQEGRAMLDMGVDARLFNLIEHKDRFEISYPELELPVIFSKTKDIKNIYEGFDAVISTLNTTVLLQGFVNKKYGIPVRGYYIQDFEPYFYQKGSADYKRSMESYTKFPDLVRFTKTRWNRDIVKENAGADSHLTCPSVDIDLFRPRPRYNNGTKRRHMFIGAMIRPSTPRREPVLTMNVLKRAWKDHKDKVEILTFGCTSKELSSLNISFDFTNHIEILNRNDFARIFNEIDIFVDFSSYQAMGLTALEAMSCGAAVIVPQTGGAKEFVKHEFNGLVIDTSSEKECLKALNRLINDDDLRTKCGKQAIKDVCKFYPEKAAYNTLLALFSNEYGSIHME